MKIVIVGDGKVGSTFAQQLSKSGHDVTMIDRRPEPLRQTSESLDLLTIEGNGATYAVQMEAGVDKADLLIAATSTDEMNLLICLIAKKAGAQYTIARVRNPEYSREISMIKEDLRLGMAINPELACANEISRVLRFPSAIKIDTFAKGRVELLKFRITHDSPLDGVRLSELGRFRASVLVCAVERGGHVYIPNGNFVLQAEDRISIVAQPKEAANFFHRIGVQTSPLHRIMILGGGRIAHYLASQMADLGADVKIVERDYDVCTALADSLPSVTVICGDATDYQLLSQEGIEEMDAVATLTGFDEQNILMSLYASQISHAKIITKVNRPAMETLVDTLDVGSVFIPRNIAAEIVTRYVRALENSMGSNVETLYKIASDQAEALEFRVTSASSVCGIPLQDLPMRPGVLLGSIIRSNRVIIPRGQDTIEPGDTVVVVTTIPELNDLDDILERHR